MDQLPHSRPDGFSNNSLFADSQQQFNSYDPIFPSAGADQDAFDSNNWGVNAGNYPLQQSRAQAAPSPSWGSQHNANHGLHGSSSIGHANGQQSPYVQSAPHNTSPYGQQTYNNYNPNRGFQYQQSQPQYDPALLQSNHAYNYPTTNYQNANTGTIAPQALQHDARSPAFGRKPSYQSHPQQARPNTSANQLVDQQKLMSSIPAGADAGLFSIIDFDNLARATNTTRMGPFATLGHEPMTWDCNTSTVPPHVARQSRSDLRRLAGNDVRLLDKIGKKSSKMQRIAKAPKTVQQARTASAYPSEKIKYEGEVSSESESSSDDDDDDSSYSSDDASEPAPLPPKRPQEAKEATEYDTIKAVWRSKRKSISSDSIRSGLVDFWEIAKTIRDRWKADANAFEEAKKKNQKGQFALLESRVKDARDMMEAALKAALKHGHRSIVEIMSENESLIYLCYQFLLDRFKAEDYNSALPRTMLELMTLWGSLTEERLAKTHVNKVLARYAKNGDAKTKYYANKITSNAAVASKEAKAKTTTSQAKPVAGTKTDTATQGRAAEPVAGVKRPAAGAAGEGTAAKKLATGSSKPTGTTSTMKQNGMMKKTSAAAGVKPATTAAAPATKTKTVTAKPSSIFSSLSASKKPGTSTASKATTTSASTASKLAEKKAAPAPKPAFSFAETMASLTKPKEEKPPPTKVEKPLPPETPEEKARRLRKESRRHLRVSFKKDDELTDVRYFTHDPDEEVGHNASEMRDVSDVGGEGRMFKQQHQMMEVDEDDEAPDEEEKGLVAFRDPGLIDFADVDKEERARNYSHRGGGKLEVDSKERAVRDYYDANNLIVVYTSPEDIPPNPREPSDPSNGEAVEGGKDFGAPEEHFATRARQKKASHGHHFGAEQQQPTGQSTLPLDLSKLNGLFNQQPNMQQPQATQQPPASAPLDISSILASLQASGNPAQMAPSLPPQMAGFPSNFQPPPIFPSQQQQPQQQQPGQTPDLASLLAAIGNQTGAAQPPAMSGGFNMPAPPMSFGQQYQQPNMTTGYNDQQRGGGRGRGGGGRGENNMSSAIRNNPQANPKYKTRTCQFWLEGKCQKGEACSYKHSE